MKPVDTARAKTDVKFRNFEVDITARFVRYGKYLRAERPSMDITALYRDAAVLLQVTDLTGRMLSANGAWIDAFGYTEPEIVDLSLADLVRESSRDTLEEALQKLNRGGRPQRLSLSVSTKLSDVVEIDASASTASNNDGTPCIIWWLNDVTERNRRERKKTRQVQELQELNDRLKMERDYLRVETKQIRELDEVVGHSPALLQTVERIKAVATTDASVLITGESGVGKELMARLIHSQSERAAAPLVTVNCASIPHDLFESEFFGHVKGAFTGAVRDRVGRFELADGGSLFLDEVGEIPLDLQGKLLRSLQQKSFERVGDEKTHYVDVRIIAATNRDLETEIENGRFREDLFYRLGVFPIDVPPLRKRKEDVPLLADHFLGIACTELHRPRYTLSNEQMRMLQDYDWPGNIRELKSVIERAVILSKAEFRLDLALPEQALKQIPAPDVAATNSILPRRFIKEAEMRQMERNNLVATMEYAGWRVAGPNGAAELLGLNASTLNSRIRKLGIRKPKPDSLYARLGGMEPVRRLADELLPALRADPQLGRFWADRGADSIRREKELLIYFLCERAGGPYQYTGRGMAEVHDGMGVTAADWRLLVYHLERILEKFQLAHEERAELLSTLGQLREDIVDAGI